MQRTKLSDPDPQPSQPPRRGAILPEYAAEQLVPEPQACEKEVVDRNTATWRLGQVLYRLLDELDAYESNPGEGTVTSSSTHASLHRATMDLSRMLVRWRKHSAGNRKPGQVK